MLRRKINKRGANAIEFAMLLPVFLTFVMGIVDFGYYFAAQAVFDAAILEGTREGAITDPAGVSNDVSGVAEARVEEIAEVICASDCVVSCLDQNVNTTVDGEGLSLREVQCTLTWNFVPLVGFVPLPATVSSSGRQLLEWQRSS